MLTFPAGETVTVLRAPLVADRYGSQVPDWGNATATAYANCGVAQGLRGSATEVLTAGRDAVISDLIVYMPPGADVRGTDRLEVRGLVYEVVGVPFDWANPLTGSAFGTAVNCDRVEG